MAPYFTTRGKTGFVTLTGIVIDDVAVAVAKSSQVPFCLWLPRVEVRSCRRAQQKHSYR